MIASRPIPVNSANDHRAAQFASACGVIMERNVTDSILPGTLVSPQWLAERLTHPALRVVDIRGYVKTEDLGGGRQHAEYVGARDEYLAAHIPGSVFIDWTIDIVDPEHEVKAQIAPPVQFAAAMGERGIDGDT